jgi:hypothetical protein
MKLQTQRTLSGFLSIAGCLSLLLLLSACNLFGGSTATPTPTSPPTQTLTTYQGDGYSISYPQNWSAKGSGNLVTFSDPTLATTFIVEDLPNPNGTISSASAVDQGVNSLQSQGKNFKKITIAPSVMLNGDTWNQSALTADSTQNGQTSNNKFIILSSNHPTNALTTKTYLLTRSAPTKIFDLVDQQGFQPMLQSFKFTQ